MCVLQALAADNEQQEISGVPVVCTRSDLLFGNTVSGGETPIMRKFAFLFVLGGAALPLTVGCTHNGQVVRGQTPVESESAQAAGPMDQAYAPPNGYGAPMNGYGPTCPPAGYGGYGAYPDPHHRRFAYDPQYDIRYRVPDGLRYPPPGDVPAVVQYPYYTHKGPDDFFLK